MRKDSILALFLALASVLSQTGCEDKTVTPKQTHWDAVRAIISQYPEVFRLDSFDAQQDTLFYREITESNADIEWGELVEEDTSNSGPGPFFPYIDLIWGDSLKGRFHYRFNDRWYQKPIRSIALTDAFFEKWGDDFDPYLGWILQRFGGTVVNSVGTTKNLSFLTLVYDGEEYAFSEPILRNPVKKDSTLIFGKGKQVTIILEPGSSTDDFFYLHVDEGQAYQKIPFTKISEDSLSASWTTTGDPDPNRRYYHAIVDVVSRESVTDTLAAYDSESWAIIYRIE
jgi:hypothetical protein